MGWKAGELGSIACSVADLFCDFGQIREPSITECNFTQLMVVKGMGVRSLSIQ